MKKVALSTAHMPWEPHQSGYLQSFPIQEHDVSMRIYEQLYPRLCDDYGADAVDVVLPDEKLRCKQPCETVFTGRNEDCEDYKDALSEQVRRCRDYELSITMHIDYGNNHGRGPMCLVNSCGTARKWALWFLDDLEKKANVTRRGRKMVGGRNWNGVFVVNSPAIKNLYKPKCFLRNGAKQAVIVELGVISSAADVEWLKSESAIDVICSAAYGATNYVFGG